MNKLNISFLRKKDKDSESYVETYEYEGDCHISILNLIEYVNNNPPQTVDGDKPFQLIGYESSCEQGMCGACAMVVNGKPVLACQTFCDNIAIKNGEIKIEPLSKFPVICDFILDRSEIFEAMKRMKLWVEGEAKLSASTLSQQYQASQCLQCGCCLEICPNYAKGDLFAGAVGAMSAMNILKLNHRSEHKAEIRQEYKNKIFNTCTKLGACEKVCPAELPTVTLMSEANRISVWKLWQRICDNG
jgi:succinate dehydrogenase / fumarate reductase, iron-sulfur subunit